MAIDAGGIKIAVALAAACRTPVANLGIRTRVIAPTKFELMSELLALLGPRKMSDLSSQCGPKRTLITSLSPIAIL